MLQFASFQLQVRRGVVNPLHCGSRLFQQFVVDSFCKVESNNLAFIRHNQRQIRAELYQNLTDAHGNGVGAGDVGVRTVLPSSFPGSPRYMQQKYQDSMALVRQEGKPTLFVTMTCNPKWPDIEEQLSVGESAQDRPDIVSRVFALKVKALLHEVIDNKCFGRATAYTYTIEFQKRGLPHVHLLLWLEQQIHDAAATDRIVSAEIPDCRTQPTLYNAVAAHMLHGPCGPLNPNAPCMKDGVCSKGFPKQFRDDTEFDSAGYPQYKRREFQAGQTRTVSKRSRGGRVNLDNRFVVPFNAYLLSFFNCHVNVEVCSSISAIKYVHKYIFKGPDRADAALADDATDVDEIQNYVDCRYVGPQEACWRLFKLPMNGISHTIVRLPVHLAGRHRVHFDAAANLGDVINANNTSKLEAYFDTCERDHAARGFTYLEFARHFRWIQGDRRWQRRARAAKVVSRMYTVSLREGERYFLRVLLSHVAGATSFEDLRTYNGNVFDSFREACVARGLVEDDEEWDRCLGDAALSQMPKQLRTLFATVLLFGQPSNPGALWDRFFTNLSDDFVFRGLAPAVVLLKTIEDVSTSLESMGTSWGQFPGLPSLRDARAAVLPALAPPAAATNEMSLVNQELAAYDGAQLAAAAAQEALFNADQRRAFNTIIAAVVSGLGGSFFLGGAGGCGKTFVYEAIAAKLRSQGKVVIMVASSGIAACLLTGGMTAHSRFKIPVDITPTSMCHISRNSALAHLIRHTSLIVWDEAVMMHRYCVEALDRSLRDVTGSDVAFGGKVVVFGGDYRQVLPVVPRGTPAQVYGACLKMSPLWANVEPIELTANMRVGQSNANTASARFKDLLLEIGEGRNNTAPHVRLPDELLIAGDTVDDLIDDVFPDVVSNFNDEQWLSNRVILTTTNADVDAINQNLCNRLGSDQPGSGFVEYKSADGIEDGDDDAEFMFPQEVLNTLTPNGMPPHQLQLKVGMIIMLLRNLNTKQGACNGTRLRIHRLQSNVIDASIVGGKFGGNRVFIPRITITPSNSTLPFVLRRRQFPVRPCFAMTINKSQGQTLEHVGVSLASPVFTHGQLYVAMSRVRDPTKLRILAPQMPGQPRGLTTNCVFKQALR